MRNLSLLALVYQRRRKQSLISTPEEATVLEKGVGIVLGAGGSALVCKGAPLFSRCGTHRNSCLTRTFFFFVYKASVHARKFTLRWGEGISFIFKLKVIYFTFYVSYSCVSVSFSLKKEIHGEVSSSNIY